MAYEKQEQLYEGKAKKVFATADPEIVIVSYKDDATAFNGLKKGTIVGKGVINNRMSNHMMRKLEAAGVPTHYVEELSGYGYRPFTIQELIVELMENSFLFRMVPLYMEWAYEKTRNM